MGLRPTRGDEKRLLSSNRSLFQRQHEPTQRMEAPPSPLSSRADPDFLLRGTRDGHVCGFH
jgi:hypothetical protein